jgi:hypothetical protein
MHILLVLEGFYHTVSYLTNALRLPLEPDGTRFPSCEECWRIWRLPSRPPAGETSGRPPGTFARRLFSIVEAAFAMQSKAGRQK